MANYVNDNMQRHSVVGIVKQKPRDKLKISFGAGNIVLFYYHRSRLFNIRVVEKP